MHKDKAKPYIKTKKVIDRGGGSKTLNEVKPVKNNENPQSFLEISLKQKEVLPSHKLHNSPRAHLL